MTPSDWEAERQQHLTDRAASLRALLAQLAEQSVTSIEVDYDGSGDSGEVESVTFIAGTAQVTPAEQAWRIVEDYACALLADQQPGWEINDGSFGTVTIDVPARRVTLRHSTRYTAHEESTINRAL